MNQLYLDIECYKDYFLVMFGATGGRTKSFEMYEGHPLDRDGILRFLRNIDTEYVTFNGNHYDLSMLSYALTGAPCAELKRASDAIIDLGVKPWEFEKQFGAPRLSEVNHLDLVELAPGIHSLKTYGGRMHCVKLQDLPFEPHESITPERRPIVKLYCRNDLGLTSALSFALKPDIELRRVMGAELGVDLRSKSDAQIAEVVLKLAVYNKTGVMPKRQPLNYTRFKYKAPSNIQFSTQGLHDVLTMLTSETFKIAESGHVEMPDAIDDLIITVGGNKYKMGIGGLHSMEKEVTHRADETTILRDIDVVSYYPSMMLNMGK